MYPSLLQVDHNPSYDLASFVYQYLLYERVERASGIGGDFDEARDVAHIANRFVSSENDNANPILKKVWMARFKDDYGRFWQRNNNGIQIMSGKGSEEWELMVSAMLPLFFPHLFKEKPLTDLERRLIKAIYDNEGIDEVIQEILSDPKLRDINDKRMRDVLYRGRYESYRKSVEEAIQSYRYRIEDLLMNYRELTKNMHKREMELYGIESGKDDAMSSIEEFFTFIKDSKAVSIKELQDDGSITLSIHTKLNNFDPDMLIFSEMYPHGYYKYRDASNLVTHIFSANPVFEINTCAVVSISSSNSYHGYQCKEKDAIPNPHITYHSCFGSATMILQDLLYENNLAGFAMQLVNSVSNMNLVDSIPRKELFEDLFESEGKVLYNKETKENMTVKEAMTYLYERGLGTDVEPDFEF